MNKNLLVKSGFILLVRAFGAGLTFIMIVLFARFLGTEDYGLFSLGLTLLGIVAVIARFGLDTVVLKQVSVNIEKNSPLAKGYLSSCILFVLIWGGLVSILVYMGSEFIGDNIFDKPRLEGVLKLFSFGVVPFSLIIILSETFKALRRPLFSSSIQSISIPAISIVMSIILYKTNLMTLDRLILGYISGVLISLIIALIFIRRVFPIIDGVKVRGKELIIQGWPMLLISSSGLIMSWTDIVVLGVFFDSKIVGIYSAAAKTVMMTSLVLIAINSITAPMYAKSFSENKLDEIENLAQSSTFILIIMAFLSSLFIYFFSEWIMSIFGESFISGATFLCILAIGQLVNVACGSVGYLLTMTGNEKKLRNIFTITGLINIAISVLLAEKIGAIGVAYATSLSLIIWNSWCVIEIKRTLGFWMLNPKFIYMQ